MVGWSIWIFLPSKTPIIKQASGQKTANSDPSSEISNTQKSKTNLVIPAKYKLSESSVPNSHNIDEWLANYTSLDQKKIRDFSERYNGVLKISGPGQIAWMAEHGYPTPEDIITASEFSTAKLKELAGQGNSKAEMLLYDRLVDEYISARDAFVSAGNRRIDFNMTDGSSKISEIMELQQGLSSLDSPFVFYLEMRNQELVQTPDAFASESSILSGLLAAQQSGDIRGIVLLQDCVVSKVCSADDAGIATGAAISVAKASQMNAIRGGCSNLPPVQMPAN